MTLPLQSVRDDNHVFARSSRAAIFALIGIGIGIWARPAVAADPAPYVKRLPNNPIITKPMMNGLDYGNICFPSLIRVPDWVQNPLGKYYLYFAAHHGKYIRLAYADSLAGPWTIYQGGVLDSKQLETVNAAKSGRTNHLASPDVVIDEAAQQMLMYFHFELNPFGHTATVASSTDGINWTLRPGAIGGRYLRAFDYNGGWYVIGRDGEIRFSQTGWGGFGSPVAGVGGAASGGGATIRHCGLLLDRENDRLHVAFSRIGDAPERIMMTTVTLGPDPGDWMMTPRRELLAPEMSYEGIDLPIVVSESGESGKASGEGKGGREHALRDPHFFRDRDGKCYLLYATAGETGIAIAAIDFGGGSGDLDGDGMTNDEEDGAGTDPLSATSLIRILSLEREADTITIDWESIPGRTYQVEYSPELPDLAADWNPLGSPQIGSESGVNSLTSSAPPGGAAFYRVVAEPAP